MRAVVQRVTESSVVSDGILTGKIGRGLMVLLGVAEQDTDQDAKYLADKIVGLRIFEDPAGKMNLGLLEVGGSMLVVSQFTLLGDCRKGRRPSFVAAGSPAEAERLYELFAAQVRQQGVEVQCGRFRTHMDVSLVNDGPVTLLLDSRKAF